MAIDQDGSRRLRWLRSIRYALTRRLFRLRLWFARRPTLGAWALRQRVRRRAAPTYDLELITVAFNNPLVVQLQYEMFRQHILDHYHWTVADNSPSRRCRRELRTFCRTHEIAYLRLPRNPYTGRDPSRSHAEALNHVVRYVAGASGAPVVGLLDHDVFPTSPCSPAARIGGAIAYGFERVQQGTRYLWPGLLFLRRAEVEFSSLDFHPGAGADTGAGMARSIFDAVADHKIVRMSRQSFPLRSTDDERYEIFDEWLHMVNASYWKDVAPKEADIVRLLQERGGLSAKIADELG